MRLHFKVEVHVLMHKHMKERQRLTFYCYTVDFHKSQVTDNRGSLHRYGQTP